MNYFSYRLRGRAKELGLSNAEVARRAGLDDRRYGHYVRGVREPDLATLIKIARALQTTPDALLLEEPRDSKISNLLKRLQGAGQRLSEQELRLVTISAEAIAHHKGQNKSRRDRQS